jgi:hypothetical protein
LIERTDVFRREQAAKFVGSVERDCKADERFQPDIISLLDTSDGVS